jgi:hypothetical protein
MNEDGFKIPMPDSSYQFKLISMFRKQEQTDIFRDGRQEIGGKALGLLSICDTLAAINAAEFPEININIPDMVVLATSVFDAFMERNQLYDVAFSNQPDHRIAYAFQKADMPFEVLGELRTLLEKWNMPLAIRSSGLLEDTMQQPFAGVYLTKMIPNNGTVFETRFQTLLEAIKFVWASTYFMIAKDYSKATNLNIHDEKMAVIIQKMVGKQYEERYYPEISGVARSFNFYPVKPAKPEDGVVSLALGLGKTVVDGNKTWTYSPKYPKMPPPFKSMQDMLYATQNEFWAVNMGPIPEYDPIKETEYMQQENLLTAEKDGVLEHLASTYDTESDRLSIGMGVNGPRVITFAPLLSLNVLPLNNLIAEILAKFEEKLSYPIEIEFAMTLNPHRFSLLQVRPMKINQIHYQVTQEDLNSKHAIVASTSVLGNGIVEELKDIVYVIPEIFDLKNTREIAAELEIHNQRLLDEDLPYILIVFGRLGTLDPWLGIPVTWGQICGAKVIVEATQENVRVELSQGSHYFHNIINLDVKYFSLPFSEPYRIKWEWLEKQQVINEGLHTRHVRITTPATVKVDGRCGWGVIYNE